MNVRQASSPIRTTYRHGNLRRALLDAGIALAREGGPQAVVLREATRRAGVVPNAAYRHFDSRAALSALAVEMEKGLARLGPDNGSLKFARASMRAVGTGYLRFARTQTGLFRTAFAIQFEVAKSPDPSKSGLAGMNPFELLGAALDRLVKTGGLSEQRRRGAEYLAWSAVHGMAMLTIDGPLRGLAAKRFDSLSQRLLDMIETGL
jgi:AcrR family transcriptional regulator